MAFLNCFKYLDFFGLKYEFMMEGNKTLKTTAGANLTISFILIVVFLFFAFGEEFFLKKSPKVVFNKILGDYQNEFPSNENATFAFRIDDTNGQFYKNESIINSFNLSVSSYKINITTGDWYLEYFNPIVLKMCEELPSFRRLKDYYFTVNFTNFYCIDFNSIQSLGGDWNGNFVKLLTIDTLQCNNITSKITCSPLESIKRDINNNVTNNQLFFSYMYMMGRPTMSNYSFPISTDLIYEYETLDIKITKRKYQTYNKINVKTDYGWIFPKIISTAVYSLDYQASDFVFKDSENDNLLSRLVIYFGRNNVEYSRSYTKIQEIFGQIGGFSNFFYILILFFYDSISGLIKYRKIMKKLRFRSNPEITQKLSLSSLKCDVQTKINLTNEKSSNIELGEIIKPSEKNIQSLEIPKILSIDLEPKKTISFIIYLKSLCLKKKMTVSENEIFDEFHENKRYFEKILEVVSLIKLFIEFEYLKKLILNDHQIIALKLIKPNFSIEEEDEATLNKKMEEYFEEVQKNGKVDEIDKKLLGFLENENLEEEKKNKLNEKRETKKELDSKLHKLINE